jgi:predicted porin
MDFFENPWTSPSFPLQKPVASFRFLQYRSRFMTPPEGPPIFAIRRFITHACMLAIAVVISSPGAARAGIDLYGTVHVSVDQAGNGEHAPATRRTATEITSNNSYIGLRGHEGVRDGLAVIWRIEQYVDLDDGKLLDLRDSYAGLESGMGNLLAGHYETPYRLMTDRLDIFAHTRADYNGIIGQVPHVAGTDATGAAVIDGRTLFDQRARNILFYTSPEQYRIRFSAAYIANQQQDDLPMADSAAARNGISAALVFDSGPLYAGVAYERMGRSNITAGSTAVTDCDPNVSHCRAVAKKAALGWDFRQGTKVALIWESAFNGAKIAGRDERRAAWYLNLSQVSGNLTYKVAYGMAGNLKATSDSGAQMIALGVSYSLARNTDVYFLGTGILNKHNAIYALQPDQADPVSVIAPAAAGSDVYAASLGLIHRFDIGL